MTDVRHKETGMTARRLLLAFVAGFLATLLAHQPMLWLLKLAGITERTPYAMQGVPPFGVPAVISLAFWGGVWGVIMIPLIARVRGEAAYWLTAALFGAIFPTLVAVAVVAPLKGAPMKGGPAMLLMGLAVNAAWGLGTAFFFRALAKQR
jgi:hypothetical protein